ncbi:type II toxin-antitoxin system Phd/YefM family antitoxin [Nocardioides stalactiti]|uniref:type II toxin-antitoxin system Phd/YefM family antitoxin n=1 Tax=Nocardioides stalactiti TaxID=2755356 RepID=UPI001603C611|nr:type II toxin-antitoxin system Phd/YefM family antitoxin [Nocardioides stalactiti]
MTVMSSREFNRDVSAAKRAAVSGPVTITDHGQPAHVLMSIADYQRLVERAGRMADRLAALPAGELPLDERRVSERADQL